MTFPANVTKSRGDRGGATERMAASPAAHGLRRRRRAVSRRSRGPWSTAGRRCSVRVAGVVVPLTRRALLRSRPAAFPEHVAPVRAVRRTRRDNRRKELPLRTNRQPAHRRFLFLLQDGPHRFCSNSKISLFHRRRRPRRCYLLLLSTRPPPPPP